MKENDRVKKSASKNIATSHLNNDANCTFFSSFLLSPQLFDQIFRPKLLSQGKEERHVEKTGGTGKSFDYIFFARSRENCRLCSISTCNRKKIEKKDRAYFP